MISRRCIVTKNQCGTDTWEVSYTCPCVQCVAYLAERAQPYGPPLACEHGHSTFLSSPCPQCPTIPLSIRPLRKEMP